MLNKQGEVNPLAFRSAQTASSFTIVAIVLVALTLRPGIASIGPLLDAIRAEFHLSHGVAALLTTIPDLCMALFAFPSPWLARRFGRNRVIIFALVLLGIATSTRALTTGTAALLAATIGVGSGIAIINALMGGFVKTYFPDRAASVMGIYATGLSFGSTAAAASSAPIAALTGGSWRLAAACWAVLSVVAIVAWVPVARAERVRRTIALAQASLAPPWRSGAAWRIALFFACTNLLFYALLAWIAPSFHEMGIPVAHVGLLLAVFTFVFMVANWVFGTLAQRSADRRPWLAACAAFAAAGLAELAIAPLLLPAAFIALAAFGLGGAFTLGMTLPLDHTRDAEEANAWNVFTLLIGYLVAATGPLIVGAVRDRTGSFFLPYVLLVVVALVMLGLAPLLRPPAAGRHATGAQGDGSR
jgi:CP family cyanate transporter-like MFS transporter